MKYLSPFAPDISGAVSVFFRLGGVSVILDAGGCTGNACGFDEPRWFSQKSAVFSAGLRDLDAILGRDRMTLDKTAEVLERFDANFLAIIGTPVPAVIGTDFYGLMKEAGRRFRIPVAAVETNGMDLYDRGASRAYLELVRIAAAKTGRKEGDGDAAIHTGDGAPVAVFGCTPLDFAPGDDSDKIRAGIQKAYPGNEIMIIGDDFADLEKLPFAAVSIVTAPSGLAAAKEMERRWKIPWRAEYLEGGAICDPVRARNHSGGRTLIVHQAVFAAALARRIRKEDETAAVRTATFFECPPDIGADGCMRLKDEEDFIRLVSEHSFDRIYADPLLERACRGCCAEFIPLPHFAVSGSAAAQAAGRGMSSTEQGMSSTEQGMSSTEQGGSAAKSGETARRWSRMEER